MFQPIEELEYNQTYKIVADHDDHEYMIGHEYKGKFKEYYSYPRINQYYLMFDHVYDITTQTDRDYLLFSSTSKFYKFVSQKARIQSDMERRAVNLIVRRLIGDDCFEW